MTEQSDVRVVNKQKRHAKDRAHRLAFKLSYKVGNSVHRLF